MVKITDYRTMWVTPLSEVITSVSKWPFYLYNHTDAGESPLAISHIGCRVYKG